MGWAVAGCVVIGAGCSGDDGADGSGTLSSPASTSSTSTSSPGTTVALPTGAPTAAPGSTSTTMASRPTVGPTTVPATTAAPPPPGLPGYDSPDAFCRDAATVLGSSNLIGVASAFSGQGQDELLTVEVVAAPSMVDAAERIAGELPPSVADDADVLLDSRIGPVLARATTVLAALDAAGVDDAGRAALAAAWADVLASDDQADPGIDLPALDASLDAQVAAAVASLSGTLRPYLQDPSLATTGARTPAVDRYLADTCPAVLGLVSSDSI